MKEYHKNTEDEANKGEEERSGLHGLVVEDAFRMVEMRLPAPMPISAMLTS